LSPGFSKSPPLNHKNCRFFIGYSASVVSIEGNLFHETWFDNWNPVFVRCSDTFSSVHHTEEDAAPLYRLPLLDCTLTVGHGRNFGRMCVFRLKLVKSQFISVPYATAILQIEPMR
jgi:hypothetical protein